MKQVSKIGSNSVFLLVLRLALPFFLLGSQALIQAQEAGAADPVVVREHWNAARLVAGDQWADAFDFFCGPPPDDLDGSVSPILEPVQLFDNLYILGRSRTVVYALTTSEGIVLIDSGYPGQEESVLIPGLQDAGLDPNDIKLVIVAHGHRDHSGGSKFIQDNYGAQVYVTEPDWAAVTESGGPSKDLVAQEGKSIRLGDTEITPVLIPGHTPGGLGLIFEVQDGDTTHTAALFGGTILAEGRISNAGLAQYIDSLAHFSEKAEEMGVDVEIHNHPYFNNLEDRLALLADRLESEEHPFVIGTDSYQNFLALMSECTKTELAQRGAPVN
jgi:metallo-beta-lactamase class B